MIMHTCIYKYIWLLTQRGRHATERDPMDGDVELLKRIYDCFNARDIDGVLAVLADDVAWANGMDGGHVFMGAKQ
jgi:hypothetical protein